MQSELKVIKQWKQSCFFLKKKAYSNVLVQRNRKEKIQIIIEEKVLMAEVEGAVNSQQEDKSKCFDP